MAAASPYQFDGVFALDPSGQEKPAITEDQLEQAREESRIQAYAEGHSAGISEAQTRNEAQLNSALDKVFGQLPDLFRTRDHHMRETEDAAVEIAILSARKLARALVAKFPLVEIVDLVRQSFDEIRTTPHVVLHLNDELSAPMAQRIEKLSREAGIEGRIIVMGDPDMAPGDARIEWADGGMARDLPTLEARIDEAVKRFVMTRRTADDPDGAVEPSRNAITPNPALEKPL